MKYGFIGCGNMGGAIARALAKVTTDIMITDRSGKAKPLAEELNCAYADAQTVAQECDRIFLAVKPQMMAGVLAPLQTILQKRKPLLITMAAGLEIKTIAAMTDDTIPVIRIMPNTPVAIGKGMTVYCYNPYVESDILEDTLQDMRFTGKLDYLEERLIDAASALSGSGPAYMYMFLEALADGAVACGIPRAKAVEYAAATMVGSAEMLMATGRHPGELKDAVCSPGGSTIVGLNELEQRGFRGAVMNCVIAAHHKNQELGKQ